MLSREDFTKFNNNELIRLVTYYNDSNPLTYDRAVTLSNSGLMFMDLAGDSFRKHFLKQVFGFLGPLHDVFAFATTCKTILEVFEGLDIIFDVNSDNYGQYHKICRILNKLLGPRSMRGKITLKLDMGHRKICSRYSQSAEKIRFLNYCDFLNNVNSVMIKSGVGCRGVWEILLVKGLMESPFKKLILNNDLVTSSNMWTRSSDLPFLKTRFEQIQFNFNKFTEDTIQDYVKASPEVKELLNELKDALEIINKESNNISTKKEQKDLLKEIKAINVKHKQALKTRLHNLKGDIRVSFKRKRLYKQEIKLIRRALKLKKKMLYDALKTRKYLYITKVIGEVRSRTGWDVKENWTPACEYIPKGI
jgi:hypothetical protein